MPESIPYKRRNIHGMGSVGLQKSQRKRDGKSNGRILQAPLRREDAVLRAERRFYEGGNSEEAMPSSRWQVACRSIARVEERGAHCRSGRPMVIPTGQILNGLALS